LTDSLRGRVSGICQPNYVLDIPGGHGKSPLGTNHVRDEHGVQVMDYKGRWHLCK